VTKEKNQALKRYNLKEQAPICKLQHLGLAADSICFTAAGCN